jgi:hypothetical protein
MARGALGQLGPVVQQAVAVHEDANQCHGKRLYSQNFFV